MGYQKLDEKLGLEIEQQLKAEFAENEAREQAHREKLLADAAVHEQRIAAMVEFKNSKVRLGESP